MRAGVIQTYNKAGETCGVIINLEDLDEDIQNDLESLAELREEVAKLRERDKRSSEASFAWMDKYMTLQYAVGKYIPGVLTQAEKLRLDRTKSLGSYYADKPGEFNIKEWVAYIDNRDAEDVEAAKGKKPETKDGSIQQFYTMWDYHGGKSNLEMTEWNKMLDRIMIERAKQRKKANV